MHCFCTFILTLFYAVYRSQHMLNHIQCHCKYTVTLFYAVCSTQHECNCTYRYTVTLFCAECSTKHGLNHMHRNCTCMHCNKIHYTQHSMHREKEKLGWETDKYFRQCWFGEEISTHVDGKETGGKDWRLLSVNWRYDGGTVMERRVEDWKFSPQLT